METIKCFFAMTGMFLMFFGFCLADSESLIPTIFFVALGGFFIFVCTRIEKAQEEKNKSKLN
jgi:hypothetical protein